MRCNCEWCKANLHNNNEKSVNGTPELNKNDSTEQFDETVELMKFLLGETAAKAFVELKQKNPDLEEKNFLWNGHEWTIFPKTDDDMSVKKLREDRDLYKGLWDQARVGCEWIQEDYNKGVLKEQVLGDTVYAAIHKHVIGLRKEVEELTQSNQSLRSRLYRSQDAHSELVRRSFGTSVVIENLEARNRVSKKAWEAAEAKVRQLQEQIAQATKVLKP